MHSIVFDEAAQAICSLKIFFHELADDITGAHGLIHQADPLANEVRGQLRCSIMATFRKLIDALHGRLNDD